MFVFCRARHTSGEPEVDIRGYRLPAMPNFGASPLQTPFVS